MKIAKINAISNTNYTLKAKNAMSKVSFGEETSDGWYGPKPFLDGHLFNLLVYNPHRIPFAVENRSKRGQYSRFLLNPKDEEYSKLVIVMKPLSKIQSNGKSWYEITTTRNEDAYKYKIKNGKIENLTELGKEEKFISTVGELSAASKLFSSLNPSKEIKNNPKVHEDKNGNITYDRQTRRLLKRFAEENNIEMHNVIAYMTE